MWSLGRIQVLFGHTTHCCLATWNLMAWKEDRTRDRDLEIMGIKEIAWAIGIEAIEKGESRKRPSGVSSKLGEKWFPECKEKTGAVVYLG